jgi:hypothetical protein
MTAARPLVPLAALFLAAALAGCHKKPEVEAPAPAPQAAAPAPAPAPAAEPSDEDRHRAEKQAKLDYGTMEDGYINDAKGQWAASAKASSTFGDDNGRTPSQGSLPQNIVGAPDTNSWTNNHQDMGFDTVEATYAKPVSATEIRVVGNDNTAAAISKLEVQGADGAWTTVWSGLSDAKPEKRGPRDWFVKTFAKTAAPVNAVKVTLANNVASGYKEVNAIQLVGE